MNGEWAIWKRAFTKEECHDIIERGQKLEVEEADLGAHGDNKNKEYRRSEVRWMNEDLFEDIFDKMWKMTIKANTQWFGFHIDELRYMQFTEYHESYKGEYKKHHDVFWTEPKHRKLSVVLQLTDPDTYEGGDLHLTVQGERPAFYKDQGTVIWFPSWTPHWVTPVTKGIRNSVVCWFEGPHWK
tara:strand:- start:2977 stop:3528 length:552 start_codon:yes stop_codon:yes gene_type:complete